MSFKKNARNVGRTYGLNENDAVETLVVMHEIIEELIDARIPVVLEGFLRTSYEATTFQDNQKIAANKKGVKRALASKKNLYIYPEQKFV